MTLRPRALLFDLDGTLVDSLDDIAAALNRALAARGLARATRDDIRRWIGDGAITLCRRAAPTLNDAAARDLLCDFEIAYRAGCLDRTRLYAGVHETLARLHAARVPMAVLSNKPDEFTQSVTAALCRPEWFCSVRGVRTDAERKPSPVLAFEAARAMGIPPAEVGHVGDSASDIATARAAGMIAVAVGWGFRPADVLREARPDHLIRQMDELPAILGV